MLHGKPRRLRRQQHGSQPQPGGKSYRRRFDMNVISRFNFAQYRVDSDQIHVRVEFDRGRPAARNPNRVKVDANQTRFRLGYIRVNLNTNRFILVPTPAQFESSLISARAPGARGITNGPNSRGAHSDPVPFSSSTATWEPKPFPIRRFNPRSSRPLELGIHIAGVVPASSQLAKIGSNRPTITASTEQTNFHDGSNPVSSTRFRVHPSRNHREPN